VLQGKWGEHYFPKIKGGECYKKLRSRVVEQIQRALPGVGNKRGQIILDKLLTFVKYSKEPQELSPSQVLKVTVQIPGSYAVDEIYLNKGEPLSCSSVAAVFGDTMLIGSVFDERVLLCKPRQ